MAQLRWLVTTYPEPNVEDVIHLCDMYSIGRVAARNRLKRPNTKVLQYLNDNQEWVGVPTVTVIGEKT